MKTKEEKLAQRREHYAKNREMVLARNKSFLASRPGYSSHSWKSEYETEVWECTECQLPVKAIYFRVGKTYSTYCQPCRVSKGILRNSTTGREAHLKQAAKWRANNPEKVKVHVLNRRALKLSTSDGTVTAKVVKDLYNQSTCHYCGESTPRYDRTIDHKVPLSRGGCHSIDNVVMACSGCNGSKGTMTDFEFVEIRRVS